jgi:hypothetical protein
LLSPPNWLADKTKWEAVDILREWEVPCAPVMSMKDLAVDPSLRMSGSIVEVDQKGRGTFLTVGSPIKFSSFKPDIKGASLLGEHTDEVLNGLGMTPTPSKSSIRKRLLSKRDRQTKIRLRSHLRRISPIADDSQVPGPADKTTTVRSRRLGEQPISRAGGLIGVRAGS